MDIAEVIDLNAIQRACQKYGVKQLRAFGSVLTEKFDPESSDIDFLVTFLPDRENLFDDFFELKFELERIVGCDVDLVMERAVKNPFFRASAVKTAQHLYAA